VIDESFIFLPPKSGNKGSCQSSNPVPHLCLPLFHRALLGTACPVVCRKRSRSDEGVSDAPPNKVPRTLRLKYWERTDECLHRKWDHMDYIDYHFKSREDFIMETVLYKSKVMLEPNMFPYDCGPNIQHWTLWCIYELSDQHAIEYVNAWLLKYMPEATEWNFDSNEGLRSIGLYHIHVYIRVEDKVDKERMNAIMLNGGDDEILQNILKKYPLQDDSLREEKSEQKNHTVTTLLEQPILVSN